MHPRGTNSLVSTLLYAMLAVFTIQTAAGMNYRGDTLTVVCFGNSTTAPRKNIEKVYPERVRELLLQAGIPCSVYNEGIGGSHAGSLSDNAFHKVRHGMDRYRSSVLERKPDWVIISFGINDSWQDKGPGTPSRLSLERFRECLQTFIRSIDSIQGRTILMSPNPLGSRYEPTRHERLRQYRNACNRIARKTNVYRIDKWSLFKKAARRSGRDVDALLTDGMHPNDEGHRLMAEEIAGIIIKKQKP